MEDIEAKGYYVEAIAFDANNKQLTTEEIPLPAYDPTAVETIEHLAEVWVSKGHLYLKLAEPMRVQVISLTGQPVYRAESISGSFQIAMPNAGMHLVILQRGNDTMIQKVVAY